MDKRKSNYTTISQSSRMKKILTQMKFAILHDKAGFAGFCILAVIIVISFLSPVVFPLDTRSDPSKIMMQPSLQHILGTDYLGRDIWAQIANGGRELIIFSLIAALIGIILGAFLGAFSAVVGGIFDELLSFFADVWLSIPRFPLLVVMSGFVRLNSLTLAIVLGILSWAGLYRTVRAEVLSLKEREFVEAAFMQNLSKRHIILKEIMPNLMGFIVVNFTLSMRAAIYSQVGLVFLGLLPLEQNWGVMINQAWTQGAIYNSDSLAYILAPTIMICLLIMSLVWVGKALEDVFNPALRK
ncbi:Dipeptide transport system permease protein DppC [Schaedlerella arabinosiphila]|jgi:peptide/nickel transport system permease protein|nr:Dipeptide transport system permease protein DppC [Schaedlerella arabinosiphila]MCI8767378.1 ABC transporter permease [Ruminococcus sp.]